MSFKEILDKIQTYYNLYLNESHIKTRQHLIQIIKDLTESLFSQSTTEFDND